MYVLRMDPGPEQRIFAVLFCLRAVWKKAYPKTYDRVSDSKNISRQVYLRQQSKSEAISVQAFTMKGSLGSLQLKRS